MAASLRANELGEALERSVRAADGFRPERERWQRTLDLIATEALAAGLDPAATDGLSAVIDGQLDESVLAADIEARFTRLQGTGSPAATPGLRTGSTSSSATASPRSSIATPPGCAP